MLLRLLLPLLACQATGPPPSSSSAARLRAPARVRLLLGGDVNLNSSMLDENHSLSYPWEGLRSAVGSADLFLINHEGAVVNSTLKKTSGQLGIHDTPSAARSYRDGNVSFVSLANNHQLGFGAEGLRQTMRFLDGQGIAHAGAGFSAREAAAPAVLHAPNATVAVFATLALPVFGPSDCEAANVGQGHEPSSPGEAGQNYQPLSPAYASMLIDAAWRAKRQERGGADFVVAFFHWGCNWDWMAERDPTSHEANPSQPGPGGSDFAARQRFARRLIDSGAVDVVWGTSSHHIQPAEIYRGKPIIYGPGNTLFQRLQDEQHLMSPPDTAEFQTSISSSYHPELSLLYAVDLQRNSAGGAGVGQAAGEVATTTSVEAIPTAHDYTRATILDSGRGGAGRDGAGRSGVVPPPPQASARSWLRSTFDRISRMYNTRITAHSGRAGGPVVWRVVPAVLPPTINASFEGGNADPVATKWVGKNTVQYLGQIKCGPASTKCSPYTNWYASPRVLFPSLSQLSRSILVT